MATTLTRKEWARRRAAIEAALKSGYAAPGSGGAGPGAIAVAADLLKLSPPSLHCSVRRAVQLGYRPVRWSLCGAPKAAAAPADRPSDTVRLKSSVEKLRGELKQALGAVASLEDIRRGVFGLLPEKLTIPTWQYHKKVGRSVPEIPSLLTSDFQAGEVINADEIDYPNSYNPAIFVERYRRLIKTAIYLAERENPKMDYPGFIYDRAGDAISGDIHADLAETQSLTTIEQAILVAEEEIRGLELLLEAFPFVTVNSVPGNHDRTTLKPRQKRFVAMTYDDFVIWAIQKYFQAKGEKRIKFNAPRSGDAYYPIYNTWFLLTHGERMGSGGGQGFIGPAATIAKGAQKIRLQYARMGKPVHFVKHGHYHTAMELPHTISNGSLVGHNEFAKNVMRAEPEPPTQTMIWVHDKWGLTTIRRIQVS